VEAVVVFEVVVVSEVVVVFEVVVVAIESVVGVGFVVANDFVAAAIVVVMRPEAGGLVPSYCYLASCCSAWYSNLANSYSYSCSHSAESASLVDHPIAPAHPAWSRSQTTPTYPPNSPDRYPQNRNSNNPPLPHSHHSMKRAKHQPHRYLPQ